MDAVHDPEKIVVVQIAPAVRAAWGEGLRLPREMATEKRMAAACVPLVWTMYSIPISPRI